MTGFGATEIRDLRRAVANSQETDGASSESSTKLLELEVRCIKVIPLLNLWSEINPTKKSSVSHTNIGTQRTVLSFSIRVGSGRAMFKIFRLTKTKR